MKDSYDFSKGERGKFYHPGAEFEFPIYLEPDVLKFFQGIAEKGDGDMQTIANEWIRQNMPLAESRGS
jgi:hypothetical protein